MNRKVFLTLALAALPLGLGACASGGPGGGAAGGAGRDPDLLTLEDLSSYDASDTYTVVRRLRGNWLRTRSTGTMTNVQTGGVNADLGSNDESQIKVYIDGSLRPEGVNALKDLPAVDVMEIRHMNARDATMQYGIDHGAGAILVTTRN